ncbi:hypothetical protein BS50DRAFT_63277 [Corynespora cassiicola Philippines]|uniref:Uncharacterized protein n=1 Tax=Corynespora cassiicola Philippines TaxID=1448308 RepID=A0A2T2NJK8_CORCC|nr:hypothetical protein BS50DRAFT_63277 [Corynespora cassiicola Philippines]
MPQAARPPREMSVAAPACTRCKPWPIAIRNLPSGRASVVAAAAAVTGATTPQRWPATRSPGPQAPRPLGPRRARDCERKTNPTPWQRRGLRTADLLLIARRPSPRTVACDGKEKSDGPHRIKSLLPSAHRPSQTNGHSLLGTRFTMQPHCIPSGAALRLNRVRPVSLLLTGKCNASMAPSSPASAIETACNRQPINCMQRQAS